MNILKNHKKIILIAFIIPLIALILGTAGGSIFILNWLKTPFDKNGKGQLIEIRKGASLNEIAAQLESEGFINNKWLFRLSARFGVNHGSLKAGEYLLSPKMPPSQILSILFIGREHLHPITIPEGLNMYEIAELIKKRNIGDKDRFIALALDKQFISKFSFVSGSNLEGYLFPSTYFFRKGETEETILEKMVKTFEKKVYNEIIANSGRVKLTPYQVIILASMVEKETALESEKSIVSSVFFNRLKTNMKLQCDPTVIYAIKNFDGNIRKRDLYIKSPYNTYRYRGLPPGPIANPGKASIMAVLNPDKTNYLYFVATKKGGHYFSKTIKEHNRAVRKYQLGKV